MSVQEALAWVRERSSVLQQRGAAAFKRVWEAAAPTGSRVLRTIQGAGGETFDRRRAVPWQVLARRHWRILLAMGAVFLLIVIWKVPQWQAAGWQGLDVKDLAKVQNDARTTLVQALGGAFLLIGLYLTFRNLQLTQDRQITEHYTRAVEQLGNDKLEVRLGAIYALERIARDSERDYWPIMEILSAYVRERASIRGKEPSMAGLPYPAADIQAILTVVGGHDRAYHVGFHRQLNLRRTDLRRADFTDAHLENTFLLDTYLNTANLSCAHLDGAVLAEAHMEGALLAGACLRGAMLWNTHLEGAIINNADLQGADFRGSFLTGTSGLTVAQLATVKTLYQAHLDPPLLAQIQRQYPHLLEEP
jgi:hypothetical protein